MDGDARKETEERIQQARAVYERHGRTFKVMWVAVGVIIVVGGLALTVLPGPATVVIPFGLVMLAVVFGWARRLLLDGVDQGSNVLHAFRDASRPVQLLTVAVALSLVAAVVAWLVL